MRVTDNKTVWRCVDWGSDKAEERFNKGKNRHDPYIVSMSLGTSFLYPMNAGDLSTIENPNLNVDRQSFLNKLGDCHYSLEEIKRGVYWKKVKQYV
jgi:hypothetical protein